MPKDFFGHPARKNRQKLRDRLCLRRPRFVRFAPFQPNKGIETSAPHDLTPFREALQVFSASLRKPARRYGYRGLKIFTSLSLRFQDFQRQSVYDGPYAEIKALRGGLLTLEATDMNHAIQLICNRPGIKMRTWELRPAEGLSAMMAEIEKRRLAVG
ncbi:hypothetical protein [Methylomonas koyamae]|uniref:hypothetical protein n=1 Tax=Methylomonas koyamae TaxID=702114 RepID=UPI002873EB8B|nr:hypothetical protein [Methylomonas koyamae]WNB74520.1 hypothetical protein RI210_14645 [Methylomonas koyamae]